MTIELGILEPIFNKISEEIIIIDKDNKITLVNSEFCKNYNISKEEAIGECCYKIIHDLDEPCSFENNICPLVHVFETKKSNRCLHNHSIKGKKEQIEQFAAPIVFKNGEIQSICKISKNIREYGMGDINNLDSNINLKQKLSKLIQGIQNFTEVSLFFLERHQKEEDLKIMLKEILNQTKYCIGLLSYK